MNVAQADSPTRNLAWVQILTWLTLILIQKLVWALQYYYDPL